jgi:hypothetical protein
MRILFRCQAYVFVNILDEMKGEEINGNGIL